MTIRRILIANRGEIALRVIRTCRRLGIEAVLAVSEADRLSVPARVADRTVVIGPAAADKSYLSVDRVIAAAKAMAVDAIHPGYGFLSENAALAAACEREGILFIGPTVEQLENVGNKLRARQMAVDAGLPVVPGGAVDDIADALVVAETVGFPLLVKAVGGGGGRGMKRVGDKAELKTMLPMAMAEAEAAFGDGRVYLERYVESGRHVEVQVLGDGKGDVIHLGDRDCSTQRRYQKLVEEAPAPMIGDALRASMHEAAVKLGRHIGYRGLGTVEFLLDGPRGEFYFLEMNARIQVEHPVTEIVTGLDLVAEQIAVAEGQPLRLAQDDVVFSGHAIECRINAEDWRHDFRPSPGKVTRALFPVGPGIRVDSHMETGASIPPNYDSLLAKLIVHGADRADAVRKLAQALRGCRIEGVATTLVMHEALVEDEEFVAGGFDTTAFARFQDRVRAKERNHG